MNIVVLIGNLGKDPELTYTQSGTAKCKFSLATSKVRKDASGEKKEDTFWHNIVVWGNQAEACGKFLAKGRKVCVVGEVESREYEKDGQRRWITEINAQRVEFLGDKGEGRREGGPREDSRPQQDTRPQPGARNEPPPMAGTLADDDDLPF